MRAIVYQMPGVSGCIPVVPAAPSKEEAHTFMRRTMRGKVLTKTAPEELAHANARAAEERQALALARCVPAGATYLVLDPASLPKTDPETWSIVDGALRG